MKASTDHVIIALLVIGIVIAVTAAIFIGNRFAQLGIPITGFATAPNATVTLSVQTTASLKFVDDSVAWGNVAVNTSLGATHCLLATQPSYTSDTCTNGAGASVAYEESGLAIENDGNTNLTIELHANDTATTLFGGTTPAIEWNVTHQEAGSCQNSTDSVAMSINTSAPYETISTTIKTVCQKLLFADATDTLNISINVSIPYDATTGDKALTIVATGTTVT